MKKLIAMLLAVCMVMAFAACQPVNDNPTEPTVDVHKKADGTMTYAEYMAAEVGANVVIEAFVQNHQSWWDNKITIYAQDADGGYYLYNMECSEELSKKLTPGTKIRAKGAKTVWAGEIEIMEGTLEILEGTYVAPITDVTSLLGTDKLIENQNKYVSFKDLTVVASKDKSGNEKAFLYNWDGSGAEGSDSDLYFSASVGGNTYTFVIEYYLTGPDSDAYKAVQNLKVGDKIDLEGYLYWYEGVQPHITKVTVK